MEITTFIAGVLILNIVLNLIILVVIRNGGIHNAR